MSHSFGQWFNECGLPGSYCRHRSMRSPAGLASYQAVEYQFGRLLARHLCVSRAEILGIGLARRCLRCFRRLPGASIEREKVAKVPGGLRFAEMGSAVSLAGPSN
jgi:hypothetical protein